MAETIIDGIVARGFRAASRNLAIQIPLKEFPEIEHCHPGSINVQLSRAVRIYKPDYETGPINWGDPNPEIFGFLRVSIRVVTAPDYLPAWIYIPHNSPHASKFHQVEIIAEKIPGISYGSPCRVRVPRTTLEAPDLIVV